MTDTAFRHLIVTGSGRSGTNLALDLLDYSAETLCRNEPHCAGSHMRAQIGDGRFGAEDPSGDAQAFLTELQGTVRLLSIRDRAPPVEKTYLRNRALYRVLRRGGRLKPIRPVLARTASVQGRLQWQLPRAVFRPQELRRALPIFKILNWSGRLAASHPLLPEQQMIHILRGPKSYLKSWFSRYVEGTADNDARRVFEANMNLVRHIAPLYGRDPESLATYSRDTLIETQLWLWRHSNETLFAALSASPRYLLIRYEDMMADKIGTGQRMFEFCGLPWQDEIAQKIGSHGNTLFAKVSAGSAWSDTGIDALIARVLEDSPLPVLEVSR